MTVTILRSSGTEERYAIAREELAVAIARLIDARTIEAVRLRSGRVMLVDEDGYDVELVARTPPPGYAFAYERVPVRALKPANPPATALYHDVCPAGTTHEIVGDVAIVEAADWD
jgi:hypothetical protein